MPKTAIDAKTALVKCSSVVLSLCLLLLPLTSNAQSTGDCNVIAASINCSEYNAFNTGDTTMDGWITLRCDTAARVTIAIGPGASGDIIHRTMTRTGATSLKYRLYTDAGRNQTWGDGAVEATVTVVVSANEDKYVPVYGSIESAQPISSGGYSDSPVITLTW